MNSVWLWFLSIFAAPPLPSTAGWGIAAGSVAILVVLPRIAKARRRTRESPAIPVADSSRKTVAALEAVPQDLLDLYRDACALPIALPALLLYPRSDRGLLHAISSPQYAEPIESLWSVLTEIQPHERVALIDEAVETLATGPPQQAATVLRLLDELASAAGDDHWQLQAWCRLAEGAVRPPRQAKRPKYPHLSKLLKEMVELVSAMAAAAEDGSLAQYRFHRGWGCLRLPDSIALPADVLAFRDIESSLAKAASTPPVVRARICDACTMALTTDGRLDETQAALMRLVRQRLGYPMIQLLPGKLIVG